MAHHIQENTSSLTTSSGEHNFLYSSVLNNCTVMAFTFSRTLQYQLERVKEGFQVLTHMKAGVCSREWHLEEEPLVFHPVSKLTNHVLLHRGSGATLIEALGNKTNALIKYYKGLRAWMPQLYIMMKGPLEKQLNEESTKGLNVLNDIIEDNGAIAGLFRHHKTLLVISWVEFAFGIYLGFVW